MTTLGIVPGPLITAYHFSAGFAAFAALVCAAVALSGIRIRGIWWLAAMCVASVGSQLANADFHVAPNLLAATDAQRWQNAWSAGQLYTLTGFLAIYTRHRHRRGFLIIMGVLFASMIAMAFQMPPGGRFAGEYKSVILEFPWGERLQMLHGELSRSSLIGRTGFFGLFLWGLYRVAIPYAREDRTGSIVISLGLVILILATALGGLVETGTIAFVYFGNYGYIFLVLLVLYLVVRKLLASNARLKRMTAALHNELDSHLETRKVVHHLSFNDRLTDLPSRAGLFNLIRKPIEQAQRQHSQFAMLHIDLDRFDVINDTLGPNVGDRLLQEVSRRLQSRIQGEDFAARMSADEFIVVINGQPAAAAAIGFADTLHELLREPFAIDEHTLHVTASIGIALYPDDADNAEALLVAADLATREAKRQGRNCTRFFRRELDDAIRERLHVGNALRMALAEQQFELYFQPQIDARDGHITSLEALIRWHHPEGGLIEPGRFIPVAEEMHLIGEVGAWVIDEACRILADWREAGIHDIRVAINLSAQQLHQTELIDTVRGALDRHGLTGNDLELEITESMVMEDPDLCIEQLRQLSALGIKLAMDDFGTGYSSLSYLRRLPIDTLKIDRSFVHDIETNDNDATICATTISMANTLGLDTVAEGIETEAQANRLRDLKCDRFQGYLFARPMPAPAVSGFLRNYSIGT
ncbi:putative Diguanylate cyclase [Sterolibacterium denitrificans]|uniref:Diguanylate cyclase n=1 Tax=Sterolibacterium denitrificans TaxID=157592 RepID=A0A7Z7HNM4_9PROT|nr:bifunctional diguanylate cyclase/phosphodiesterase [Sterolibacterium denitrificans]SMB21222.1 putative Diguanylate cyclase [Sterolibacterium denitrificans]